MSAPTNLQTTMSGASPNSTLSSAPYSRTGHRPADTQTRTAGSGTNFPHAYGCAVAQTSCGVGDTNLPETNFASMPITATSPAPNLLPVQSCNDPQCGVAGQDTNSQATNQVSEPNHAPSSAPNSPHGHRAADDYSTCAVGGHTLAGDQQVGDAQMRSVSGTNPAASHSGCLPHGKPAGGAHSPTPDHLPSESHGGGVRGGFLRDPVLGILADVLDDLEKVRIANENRVRQLTRTEADSDGEERGHGLTLDNPMVKKLVTSVESLAQAEKDATANLQKAMKAHPLGPWVKSQAGVGEKQAARLLATIGDPYWNDLHDRPRTVSELWAFCGYAVHDGHAQARRRGERSNWSADAKMRTYLISVSCVKQSAEKSKYRRVYDEGRAKYADAVHPHDCKRCGPAGKPAAAGSPLSAGHQHNRAIRLISKELLKDLWIASRDLYLAKEA